jgi:AcrR family transcriptional regulator
MDTRTVPPHPLAALNSVAGARAGDAEEVRARLLRAGLDLFAGQGFAKTSIRQIAQAANANVAAVSYYFGDKAGLYRALLRGSPDPARSLASVQIASLQELYTQFVEPLRHGQAVRLWLKLYRREMLEPTGLWQEKIDHDMRPMHAAVVALVCRRLKLARPDDDVRRLAITLVGMAVHLFIGCDVMDVLAPQLVAGPQAIDVWRDRLVTYGEALIAAERRRRSGAARRPRKTGVTTALKTAVKPPPATAPRTRKQAK